MRAHDRFENCMRKKWGHGVSHLLLLKADRPFKGETVGKGLQACGLANGKTSILSGVNEHVLTEVADHDRRLSEYQPFIDAGMAPSTISIIFHHRLGNVGPVSTRRDLGITFDHISCILGNKVAAALLQSATKEFCVSRFRWPRIG